MSDQRPVHAWEIWANPILKRYCRARLRKKHLIPWSLIVLIVTLFIVFLLYTVSQRMTTYTWEDGARIALVPLVILQMFLLMFLGTGAVAAGIARESIDGMIDYQRLTPMTPLAKILGYLFGLPVREYVLTAITVPFVIYCGSRGGVPAEPALKFYSVFFSSVILYHLTGLVAGSVVKRKFLAGRTAQFLVAILYLVLPRFAVLGFIFLVYLTVLPAWSEQALPFFGDSGMRGAFRVLAGEVPWFRWEFSPTVFSLLIQGALIVVFVVILSRKWRDPDAHVLGHGFSLLVFGGFLALVLGNALPLIEDGAFFDAGREFARGMPRSLRDQSYGWFTMAIMGVAIFLTILLVMHLLAPNRHEALRGFRRSVKRGKRRVAWYSDDNTSFAFVLVLLALGWSGWGLFSQGILEAREFASVRVSAWHWLLQGLALCLPLLAFHFLLEWRGWRTSLVVILFLWVVPPLGAIILGASGRLETAAIYLASVSGPLLPVYAILQVALEENRMADKVGDAYWFSATLYAVTLPYLFVRWRHYRSKLHAVAKGLG